jgi:SAM-dependent methyltransferase
MSGAQPDDDILSARDRLRQDPTPDAQFYAEPRMVAHIDEQAVTTVTAIYRELLAPLAPDGRALDLMSSRYSHLPADVALSEVVGLGMNADELAENPQLTSSTVHDLNTDPNLPFEDESFDAVVNTVSVQYLLQPVAVFRDVARILKPGAPYVVVFSNRMFPTKAILAWRARDDQGHIALVTRYFVASGAYDEPPEVIVRPGKSGGWFAPPGDPVYVVVGRKRRR